MIESHIYAILADKGINQIDAGWRKFSIVFEKSLHLDGQECYGITDFENGTLSLATEVEHTLALETLLHELMHIVFNNGGLDPIITESQLKLTNEEGVTQVTRQLMQLARLNPPLMKIVFKELCYPYVDKSKS